MSVQTLRKIASSNVKEADKLLDEWRHAIDRGDVTSGQAMPMIDAILDLRTAASLTCASRKKAGAKNE